MAKFIIQATWDDVPHLSQEEKESLLGSYSQHEREARAKGLPALGSGVIYPILEDEIIVEPFAIPEHWPVAYGMDVGWNRTAVVWGAIDPDSDTVYLFSEHYRGKAEASVHADAIRARGSWIPGVIDPAAKGRSQADGKQLYYLYLDLGLDIGFADNAVEAGINAVWQRLSSGRLKVFKNLENWFREYRLYRRNEDGRIVKSNDHLMDATRYLILSGLDEARTNPFDEDGDDGPGSYALSSGGRNPITGY